MPNLLQDKTIRAHSLEAVLGDDFHAVVVRRKYFERLSDRSLVRSPHLNYNYSAVKGACCESVIGYVPIPVGGVGPLNLDGQGRRYTTNFITYDLDNSALQRN